MKFLKLFFCTGLILFIGGCASAPKEPVLKPTIVVASGVTADAKPVIGSDCPEFIASADSVPLKPGTRFGVCFIPTVESGSFYVGVQFTVHFPPPARYRAASGKWELFQEGFVNCINGHQCWAGFIAGPDELRSGTWRIEYFHKGTKLFEQEFIMKNPVQASMSDFPFQS